MVAIGTMAAIATIAALKLRRLTIGRAQRAKQSTREMRQATANMNTGATATGMMATGIAATNARKSSRPLSGQNNQSLSNPT
jgi:hypothetical protein